MDPFLRLVYEMYGHFRYWDLGTKEEVTTVITKYAQEKSLNIESLLACYDSFLSRQGGIQKLYNPYFHDPNHDWSKELQTFCVLNELLNSSIITSFFILNSTDYNRSVLYQYALEAKKMFVDITEEDMEIWEQRLLTPRLAFQDPTFDRFLHNPNRKLEQDKIKVIYAKLIVEQPEEIAFQVIKAWSPTRSKMETLLVQCKKYFDDFKEEEERLYCKRMNDFFQCYPDNTTSHPCVCDRFSNFVSHVPEGTTIFRVSKRIVEKEGQMTMEEYHTLSDLPLKIYYHYFVQFFKEKYFQESAFYIDQFVMEHQKNVFIEELPEPMILKREKLRFQLQYQNQLLEVVRKMLEDPYFTSVDYHAMIDLSYEEFQFYFQEWFSYAFSRIDKKRLEMRFASYKETTYQKKKA